MKLPITKSNIDAIGCGDTDKFIWDIALKGFGVKITPRNRRVFIYQYRDHRLKTRRITIGHMGDFTVSQAKREVEKLRGRILELDGNLEGDTKITDQELPLRALGEQFLSEYVFDLKPRTQTEYKRVFQSYLPKQFLDFKPEGITRAMVSDLREQMRDNPHGFNRVAKVMSKFFNWLYDAGRISNPVNPFQRVKKYKEKSSERYLNSEELTLVLTEISKRKAQSACAYFALSAIELLIFTGARKSEVLCLEWADVCLESNVLNLEDSKTGKKKIYLNEQAIGVISQIPRSHDNPFVIVGRKDGGHLSDIRKTWNSVCAAAGIDHTRIHDLRHTFASMALKNGVNLHTVGALLGHRNPRTTQRYVHFDDEYVKDENRKTGLAIANRRQRA